MFRLAIATLLLSGTIAVSESTPEPTSPIPSDDSILTQQPCEFPCWYGIIPGASTFDDVHEQLQNLPFYRDAKFHDEKTNQRPNFAEVGKAGRWYNLYTTVSWHGDGYSNLIFLVNNVVSEIQITPNVDFTLQDILDIGLSLESDFVGIVEA